MALRKIVFRGKSLQNGEWYLVNLFITDTIGRTHVCTPERGRLIIDPNTVGQFTGMRDKNGKEIYEDDIIKVDDSDNGIRYIKWNDEYSQFVSQMLYGEQSYCIPHKEAEVIGNVHDNPELLKGREKMTTDELLKKLPSLIGRNPIYNEGEIIGYVTDENDGCDTGWLYLHNDRKGWYAYYGDGNECVTLNPLYKPPYNNALFYGNSPQEALQELYNWCIKNGFVKGGEK